METLVYILLAALGVSIFFNVRNYRDMTAWRQRYYDAQNNSFAPSLFDHLDRAAQLALKAGVIYALFVAYRRIQKLNEKQP